jgi:hypothetical protein
VGDPIRLHLLIPYSEQAHVFNLEGHQWPLEPGRHNSDLVSSLQVRALEAIAIVPVLGAGGAAGLAGDYVYGDHRGPFREAGLWEAVAGLCRRRPGCRTAGATGAIAESASSRIFETTLTSTKICQRR